MTGALADNLQRALAITQEMLDAAANANWAWVAELDVQRQLHLQAVQRGTLNASHRDALQSLQAHNSRLLAHAGQIHAALAEQLSQHQYNHRALQTYIDAAR